MFRIPITFKNYTTMLQSMISGNIQAVLDPQQDTIHRTVEPIAFMKQAGVVLLTIVQGIVQPYWTYKHLRSIDGIILEHGTLLIQFREKYMCLESKLADKGITFFRCPIPVLSTERVAMAYMLTQSFSFKMALKYIGSFEVLFRLSATPGLFPVQWVSSKTPVFRLRDTFDYQVSTEKRKVLSVAFDSKKGQHALLTGPNKGGKSTALRAIAMSALLAHTYGCAFGHLTSTPFSTIHVCLKPDDLPGSKSRFEREIEFTANTLREKGHALVLIDELYHSTNPPDALRSCEIYSTELWKHPRLISIISTHLFDWVHQSPSSVQRLCCPAEKGEKGHIQFSYELVPGVCTVSSVDSLLCSNGFSM
jgi:energy-coupling factor transporter ATP-binding protein EcfA2